jgi:exodeoxyribonuclease VII large subunit
MTPSSRSGDMELFPPHAVPRAPAAPRMPSVTQAEATYSVSQINGMAQAALKQSFPRQIWVRGEIQGYDLRKHRETVSFTLAEKSPNSDDVSASVTALMFGDDRRAIDALLRQSQNAFELQDGIEVRFRVEVDLWAKAGRYQLRVRGIDPTYTLGRLAQNRRRILERLHQRGLMTKNKERPLPLVPLRIGLIGAKGSAGLNDFITHLHQSGFAFDVQFVNAAMQGADVERDVMAAIRYFDRAHTVDVIVITRGGGAATDLSWFDREKLGETIANAGLPVLTGLGHTHDTSVADLVAHADLKTPTDAAQFLVDRVGAFLEQLATAARRLGEHTRTMLDDEQSTIEDAGRRITSSVGDAVQALSVWATDRRRTLVGLTTRMVSVEWQFLRGCGARVSPERMAQLLARQRQEMKSAGQRLTTQTVRLVQLGRDAVTQTRRACTYPRLARGVGRERDWLGHSTSTVAMLDPAKTLRRGFSIVRNAQGQIISKTSHVAPEQVLTAQVSDGYIRSRVESITPLTDEASDG